MFAKGMTLLGRRSGCPNSARGAVVLCFLAGLLVVSSAPVPVSTARAESAETSEAYNLARDAIQAGDFETAVRYMEKALASAEAETEANDKQIGILAYNLGQLQLELGEFVEARSSLEKAVARYITVYDELSPRLVSPLGKLATCLEELNENRDAYHAYRRIVDIKGKQFGGRSVEVANALAVVAQAANGAENHKKAQLSLTRALRIWNAERGPRSIEAGQASLHLGLSELRLREFSLALPHIAAGVDILEEALPLGHPYKVQLYTTLEKITKHAQSFPEIGSSDIPDLEEVQLRLAANRAAANPAPASISEYSIAESQ